MDIVERHLELPQVVPVEKNSPKVEDFAEAARYRGFWSRDSAALRLRDGQVRRRGSCFRLFNLNVGKEENRRLRHSFLDAIRREYGKTVADVMEKDLIGPRGDKCSNLGAKEVRAAVKRALGLVPDMKAVLASEPPEDHLLIESPNRFTVYDKQNAETITVPQCAIYRLSRAEREAASAIIQNIIKEKAAKVKFSFARDSKHANFQQFLQDEFRNVTTDRNIIIDGRPFTEKDAFDDLTNLDDWGREHLMAAFLYRLEELYPESLPTAERALNDLGGILHQGLTAVHLVNSKCIPKGNTQRPWSIQGQNTRFRITREENTMNLLVTVSEKTKIDTVFFTEAGLSVVEQLYRDEENEEPFLTLTSELEIRYRYTPPSMLLGEAGKFEVLDDIERIEFREIKQSSEKPPLMPD